MVDLEPGEIIDERYRIIARLGEGGMGSVFSATELELNRVVAIKLLHPDLLTDEEQRTRFEREGKILCNLSHPFILKVFRFGLWKKTFPYIVMEYLEGKSLRDEIDQAKQISIPRSVSIAQKICSAMQFAHDAGVIHRDLKPNNVVLIKDDTDDVVKVVDFGLARLLGEQQQSQHLTQTGMLVGSVHYMSPEQCTGKRADSRSDIYSLACVLYESISGEPPLTADNPIGLLHKHATETPEMLAGRVRNVGSAETKMLKQLDAVLLKAMAKSPDERYQTMSEFARDLQLIDAGKGEEVRISGTTVRQASPGTRKLILPICAAIVAGAAVLFLPKQSGQSDFHDAKTSTKIEKKGLGFLSRVEALRRLPSEQRLASAKLLAKEFEAGANVPPYELTQLYSVLNAELSALRLYKELHACLTRAVVVARERSAPDLVLSKLLYFRADCGAKLGLNKDALKDIRECSALLKDYNGDDKLLAAIVTSRCRRYLREYAQAEKELLSVLSQSRPTNATLEQAYSELAHLCLLQDKLKLEENYFSTALELSDGDKYNGCLSTMLIEWPPMCKDAGHQELITKRVDQIMKRLSTKSGTNIWELNCSAGVGCALSESGQVSAEKYFRRALAAAPADQVDVTLAELSSTLIKQGRLAECTDCLYKVARSSNDPSVLVDLLKVAAQVANKGDIEPAKVCAARLLAASEKGIPPEVLWQAFETLRNSLPAPYKTTIGTAYLQKVLPAVENSSLPPLAIAHRRLAMACNFLEDENYARALPLLQAATPVIEKRDKQENTVFETYRSLVWCYSGMNNLPLADDWARRALAYADQSHMPRLGSLHRIADAYLKGHQEPKATEHYEKAFEYANKQTDEQVVSAAGIVLGAYSLQRHRLPQSELALKRTLPIAMKPANLKQQPQRALDMWMTLAGTHFRMEKFEESSKDAQQAYAIACAFPNLDRLKPLMAMFDAEGMLPQTAERLHKEKELLRLAKNYINDETTLELRHTVQLREAVFLSRAGDTPAALKAFDTICSDYDKTPYPDPHYALTFESAALTYASLKQFERAISLQQKATTYREKYWGRDYDTEISRKRLQQFREHKCLPTV